ncbi:sulfurtransferase [Actinoplanes derwentensis]|uniref:Thiosulfate/3-mercaptopyruvate sulfurtransferase n=1 Tax=Actinoplanes derwentensis TaxID=113562 RepID=A0A1H2BNS6_9ACTN|nr:rhodanese-like domain-containing protein [Actinoplanes derwentensis]GID86916.1 sulfurtransferase [Actinoplanes derwentensis]SDT59945.1 thiosulfate/3-mercaptopyruvate sulfurtransferase [Actinoplanes derwentensis]
MTGPILAADDLLVRLEQGDVIVLDATVDLAAAVYDGDHRSTSGRPGWEQAHIPGSRHADLLHDLSDPAAPYHFARPTPEILTARLADLGVRDGVPVVVYDRSGGIWAARLWWLLDSIGIEAAVLDGGFAAWQAAGLPVSAEVPFAEVASAAETTPGLTTSPPSQGVPPPAASVTEGHGLPQASCGQVAGVDNARAVREERWIGREHLQRWLRGEIEATVLCALNPEAYAGEVPTRYSRRGHIPGSGNLPTRSLLGPDGRFRPLDELRTDLADLLADPAPIWLYCGGGISAATLGLALTALGRDDVSLYDGSLEEWSADESLPLVLGRADESGRADER